MKLINTRTLAVLAGLVAIPAAHAAITIDGTMNEAEWGLPAAVQSIGTDYGDNTFDTNPFASGTELDALYVAADATDLYIGLAGNVETNFNKFLIWIDSKAGGENTIGPVQPGWDFGFLGGFHQGSGVGFTFDAGFEADYAFNVTNGDVGGGTYGLFANYFIVGQGGETPASGAYLGTAGYPNVGGALTGGTSSPGVFVTINNSNAAGVDGSAGGASSGAGVNTGAEWKIAWSAIGVTGTPCDLKIVAQGSGGGGSYCSNQMLPALPVGTGGVGQFNGVNLNNYAGTQHIILFPSVKGTIQVNGWVADYSTGTVEFLDGNGNVVGNGSITIAADGSYTACGPMKGGNYTMRIQAQHGLVKAINVDTSSGPVTGVNASLINGDVNLDNEVGPADFTLLSASFGLMLGDTGYNANADLNGDDEVGPADFTLLSQGFGEQGD